MKAVQLVGYGDVDQLQYSDVPDPVPGPGEILVQVAATSINPIDWKLRSGAMKTIWPLQFPTILGNDVTGQVVGSGRRVMAMVRGGAYAEIASVREQDLADVPEGMSAEQAAGIPLVVLTGAQLIENGMKVSAGHTILVTGALGSVGRTAVFTAKRAGATVLAGVRASQREQAAELKADGVVALDGEQELHSLPPLDGVADTVGGEIAARLLPAIKPDGVYGSVLGPPQGAEGYSFRVAPINAQPDGKRLAELAQAIQAGEFSIPVARAFPLAEVAQAHKLAEKGSAGGKVVLLVRP